MVTLLNHYKKKNWLFSLGAVDINILEVFIGLGLGKTTYRSGSLT